jgi:Ring finger domain
MKLHVDDTDVFVIFDSHPRPSHPDGAVFILNTSIHKTAAHLKRILPVDRRLLSDSDLQWQAQLLGNFSGHTFVSKGADIFPAHMIPTITESSLAILALRAEVSDLKLQNSVLTSENKRLVEEKRIEDEYRDARIQIPYSLSKYHGSNGYLSRSVSARVGNATAGPSPESNVQKRRKPGGKDRNRFEAKDERAKTIRRHFECRICMEEHIEDSVARIDSCGHSFCRECVRDYVGFKLDENRFPILCPICMTGQGKGEPGSA